MKQTPTIDPDLVSGFTDYWSEKNLSGRKMIFEMQKTFDIQRRLATWCKNAKEWGISRPANLDQFPLDKTGNARLGRCSKCNDIVFLDKINPILDSTCCKAKVIGKEI